MARITYKRYRPTVEVFRPEIVVETNHPILAGIYILLNMWMLIKIGKIKQINFYLISIPKITIVKVEEERLASVFEVEEAAEKNKHYL